MAGCRESPLGAEPGVCRYPTLLSCHLCRRGEGKVSPLGDGPLAAWLGSG